jgi:hypothetical protein
MEVYEAMTIIVITLLIYGIFILAVAVGAASLGKEQLELWRELEDIRDSIAETNAVLSKKEDRWYD